MGLSAPASSLELEIEAAVIDGILDQHERAPSAIIAVLQDMQEEVNYLPEGALRYVAEQLDIPASKVYSLATFYRAFSLEPRGEHQIYVCTGTACHVRGAGKIIDALEREIGIQAGETDEKLEFTLETVNCVGACALGPVIVVDGEYHGQMTAAKAVRLVKKLRNSDNGKDNGK
ncbi:MAG: NAD(P)H-dependent oxidoreductase subunit E [Chloroflexi bacterium]|nr:NAD(P)H-dependent oxidoreductase subunit E [Chloroflexota bacterium]